MFVIPIILRSRKATVIYGVVAGLRRVPDGAGIAQCRGIDWYFIINLKFPVYPLPIRYQLYRKSLKKSGFFFRHTMKIASKKLWIRLCSNR